MEDNGRRNFIKTTLFGFSVLVASTATGGFIYRFSHPPKNAEDSFWDEIPHISHFDMHIVEHCNLKCKYCFHFSCVAEEEYKDLKSFENDIKRISEVTEQKIKRVYIDGGEPLLHPQVAEFLPVARKYLPLSEINLVTNGLLLTSMKDDFWRAMHDNDIVLNHSPYPVGVDIDGYYSKAKQYDVKTDKTLKYIKNNPVKVFGKLGLIPKGDLDFAETWENCDCKIRCAQYFEGKLFSCPAVAYIRHFNKKFGYNLEVTDKDYIDVYKTKNIDEILSFLNRPFPFCRYCKGFIDGLPWEQAEIHEAIEWLE